MDRSLNIVCIISILILALMYVIGLGNNLMDYDEGAIYLYPGMLAGAGAIPYVDFTYNQPILWLFNFGSIIHARLATLFTLFILAFAVFFIGRKFGVGWFSLVFLLSSPLIMHYGRLAVGDIPALAMLSMVILCALDDYSIFTFVVASVAAILIKVEMAIPVIFICGFLCVFRKEYRYLYAFISIVIIFCVVCYITPNMFSSILGSAIQWIQLGQYLSYLIISIGMFIYYSLFMLPFVIYGGYVIFKRFNDRKYMIILSVLASIAVVCVTYQWLNYRHFMYLIPIMSVLAGISLKSLNNKMFMIIVILLMIFVPVYELRKSLNYDYDTRALVDEIVKYTGGTDMIYTDQPMLAYLSKRAMPDTATQWNGMGKLHNLTADKVINDISNKKPEMVLLVTETPIGMDPPRIISTFNESDAQKIYKYLNLKYRNKSIFIRNYQHITVWTNRVVI